MLTRINQFALTVRDYDEAIAYYVGTLGFALLEDTDMGGGKRWVRIAPPGSGPDGAAILLARAATPEQLASVGNQTSGLVFIFIHTDNFERDHAHYLSKGVVFNGPARKEPYGTVAVFTDLYGNKWDLIEPTAPALPADQRLLGLFWNDAWGEGLWAAGWEKSLEGLTPQQAAWSPPNAPGVEGVRHSIWQNVVHMCFWREDALRRLTDPTKPDEGTVRRLNFPVITDTGEPAWAAAKARFAQTQQRIAAVFATPGADTSRLRYMLPHDCYHMGQINMIRAMLGLAPLE